MASKLSLSLFMLVMSGCIVSYVSSQKTIHIVGDSLGWIAPKYTGFYHDWVKNRKFSVGDQLLFNYIPGLNTVVQVEKEDYDHCSMKNTLAEYFMGNTIFTLNKPGEYYFISSVGRHCEANQKLKITVTENNH
ncbi:hypothetical protein PIB30_038766 [Stylosanthes scabra]|uniref:Phytocyanin domain-containing protein n=1 Tax=Stylosanthes scabra TaxID=79078 RepID=A0ABU6WC87_9FABA|nr:hypothetical protein [Stylosanthes scabra]